MTQEQIFTFANNIQGLNGFDLEELKRMIDVQIRKDYDKKENFFLHDQIDDYLYIVHFTNGDYCHYCKGSEAYQRYLKDDGAWIERKTKDLFPKYEFLLRKDTHEQKGLRH